MSEEKSVVSDVPSTLPPMISLEKRVTLPSRGVFYKVPEGPANVEVLVKAMRIKEEKLLADPSIDRVDTINVILKNCLEGLPVPIDHLLLGDRLYLLLVLRSISYGPNYGFVLKCPACGSSFNHNVHLPEGLGLRVLEETDTEPFFVDLPVCGKKVGLRLLRVSDEKAVLAYAKRMALRKGQNIEDDTYYYRLAKQICSVDEKDISIIDAKSFVESLYSRDSYAISDALEDYSCGPDLRVDAACPSCGHSFDHIFEFTVEFFRPERTTSRRRQL